MNDAEELMDRMLRVMKGTDGIIVLRAMDGPRGADSIFCLSLLGMTTEELVYALAGVVVNTDVDPMEIVAVVRESRAAENRN